MSAYRTMREYAATTARNPGAAVVGDRVYYARGLHEIFKVLDTAPHDINLGGLQQLVREALEKVK